MLRSLLTLSDVMGTGHHAAVSAGVKAGDTVAVVGDGAVGLSGVLAAKPLGAGRIIALSAATPPSGAGTAFGATDIVAERGEEAVAVAKELTDGVGVDAASNASAPASRWTRRSPSPGPARWSARRRSPRRRLPSARCSTATIGVRGGGRPVPRLHARAARRRPRRAHRPRPGPRLRDRPGRHRRGLRRDGRAPRDQVTRAEWGRSRRKRATEVRAISSREGARMDEVLEAVCFA